MTGVLQGRNVLITSAGTYMGPAIAERFAREGARIVADDRSYEEDPSLPAAIVRQAGEVDILVVNLQADMSNGLRKSAHKQDEQSWQRMFTRLVHPTMRFVSAVLPQMIERRAGKIIVVTSAAPLRAVPGLAAYSAARAAQNNYVKVVGAEVAPHNIQVNAVAQHFTIGGFAADAMDDPATVEWVRSDVPAQRLSTGAEQAALCLYLASPESGFMSGQVFPYAGGWVTT